MNKQPDSLVDFAAQAGPSPEGVDLSTWLIAELPPVPLTRAAKWEVPSYQMLVEDKHKGGNLLDFITKTPLPERALGEDILLTQQRLARPRRRIASLACALAVAGGTGAFSENVLLAPDNSNGQKQTLPANHWELDAFLAVPAGLMSGLVASMIALGFSNRLSVGPARKIVRNSQQETGSSPEK
jgi:hypothetical protein